MNEIKFDRHSISGLKYSTANLFQINDGVKKSRKSFRTLPRPFDVLDRMMIDQTRVLLDYNNGNDYLHD